MISKGSAMLETLDVGKPIINSVDVDDTEGGGDYRVLRRVADKLVR